MSGDNTLSGWQAFSVNVPKPTLAVQNDPTATAGQQVALSSLVSIADPGHVGFQKLELWDSDGTVAGGHFVVNGMAQTGGHEIDVTPANVANTVFDAGTAGGSDTLWAQLMMNDGTLTGWQQFTVSVSAPAGMAALSQMSSAASLSEDNFNFRPDIGAGTNSAPSAILLGGINPTEASLTLLHVDAEAGHSVVLPGTSVDVVESVGVHDTNVPTIHDTMGGFIIH